MRSLKLSSLIVSLAWTRFDSRHTCVDVGIGRKYSVFFWSSVFTVGSVIQVSDSHPPHSSCLSTDGRLEQTASDRSIVQLMVGRFVAGLGVGALSAIVPLYSGEAAPRHLRGSLLSLYQVMIIFGLFVSCRSISPIFASTCTDDRSIRPRYLGNARHSWLSVVESTGRISDCVGRISVCRNSVHSRIASTSSQSRQGRRSTSSGRLAQFYDARLRTHFCDYEGIDRGNSDGERRQSLLHSSRSQCAWNDSN